MKKGRHRRFEEARALKQAFELGVGSGSALIDAPFDADGDELRVNRVSPYDPSDLNVVLWLGEPPTTRTQAELDEAVEEWLEENTASGGEVIYAFDKQDAGQSSDGRHFVWWWADLGKAKPSEVLVALCERLDDLRQAGLNLVSLQVGGSAPDGARAG